MTDKYILEELGKRIARVRIDSNLTQAAVAVIAGVSKSTLERFEKGESIQMVAMIRILRALNCFPGLDNLIPDAEIRPLDMIRNKGKRRQRVRHKTRKYKIEENSTLPIASEKESEWKWGDDK